MSAETIVPGHDAPGHDAPGYYDVPGFDAAGIAAGIKKSGAPDLALIASRVPCRAAATFTRNAFPAAPVLYDRQVLALNPAGIHALVINAGCANACTGTPGDANARRMAELVEQAIGAGDHAVFVMSTGVIGVQLPLDKLALGVPQVVAQLRPDGWPDAARAIMTTDTRPKLLTRTATLDGVAVRFTGIAKGAGMIHPDMATMLSAIVTDAAISQPLLQQALSAAVDRSYNRISIDGDTSTNDTVVLLANGLAGNPEITVTSSAYAAFVDALTAIATELAQAIVRDGEGATKFITVRVQGGRTAEECRLVAYAIAHSPLVKTAFYASDPNLGRILAAVGYAGIADLDQSRIDLYLDDVHVAVQGGRNPSYREEDGQRVMKQSEITVRVVLGRGTAEDTVWTCDFSHDYVSINADYRS